ncbi:MAG TPA: hypothetical protein VFL73_08625 [Solirubrobacteraceae bacterium]|nr:hypothetical protein [Solirubrobacteraceae bacterium]
MREAITWSGANVCGFGTDTVRAALGEAGATGATGRLDPTTPQPANVRRSGTKMSFFMP